MTEETTTWYDETFKVVKTRFGLFTSENKDGQLIVSGPTLESCVQMTRFYLKGQQDGWTKPSNSYSGTVGGKL